MDKLKKEIKKAVKEQKIIIKREKPKQKKLDKVRRKAEIVQNAAKKIPTFNEKIENVLEINNIKYGEYDNNKLDIYYKNDLKNSNVVIFIHGGGWCSYDKDFYKTPLKKIANMNNLVFNCNYRLAPESTISDMEKDIFKIFDYVIDNCKKYGGSKKNIVLMGDSAGAHLVSLVTNKLFLDKYENNKYKKYIKGLALFYGVYNIYDSKFTKFNNIKTFINSIIDINSTKEEMDNYSPIYYISNKLPKIFIASGENDKLHSESVSYYNALLNHDVKVEKLFINKKIPSARHSFLNLNRSKAFNMSLEALNEFLNNL